jgi:hypothetical protein
MERGLGVSRVSISCVIGEFIGAVVTCNLGFKLEVVDGRGCVSKGTSVYRL